MTNPDNKLQAERHKFWPKFPRGELFLLAAAGTLIAQQQLPIQDTAERAW